MKTFGVVLGEAFVVGVLLILIVYIVGFGLRMVNYPMGGINAELCKSWNDNYYMEICLLLSGMLFHMGAEYTGLNANYARDYFK